MKRLMEEYGAVILVVICTCLLIMMIPTFAYKISNISGKLIDSKTDMEDSYVEPIEKSLSIDSVIYSYEEGMSWMEWMMSSYNTGHYSVYTNPCDNQDYLGKVIITNVRTGEVINPGDLD